jgi:hypothetical protein
MKNKRHMTFSLKTTGLNPSSPSNYTFTEKQHEVDDSPTQSREVLDFKD